MSNYKVDIVNPCPMSFRRIQDSGFNCSSCKKKILDFRNIAPEKIRENHLEQEVCGIFNSDQVHQRRFGLNYRLRFAVLAFIALIGINVKPLSAQDSRRIPEQTEAQKLEENENKIKSKKAARAERKWFNRRNKSSKKKVYRIMGCPSF